MTPAERAQAGRAARKRVPPAAHTDFAPAAGRADPVDLIIAQEQDRLPELLPIRHGRMVASPFAFYRGSANVMAADLAAAPSSGLKAQLCGDAHLSNFGMFASPERRLIFDVNDFDETSGGPWEWDLKRLLASLTLAGRSNGFKRRQRAEIVLAAARAYREAMAGFAGRGELEVWYARADVDDLAARLGKASRKKLTAAGTKARGRDSLQAYRKLTAVIDGNPRIVADPPLLVPVGDLVSEGQSAQVEAQIRKVLGGYRDTLPDDKRRLIDAFRFVDLARKVVGVGSVGTRCWIVLLTGRDHTDPLLLQVKEAGPSVLAPNSAGDNHGRRVVRGQRLMQAASDIFLGWQRVTGVDGRERDFYVRQLRDWKGSAVVDTMDFETLLQYGRLCAWTLARAHARSGDRIAIAAYLGDDDRYDRAFGAFAQAYADQTEHDHAAFASAIAAGRLEARTGI
ncbi:DUF2252 domain-containing protein [Actinoplanes solisilvae]|uniref:DUF2252 domain-containing protein n=1 Tax=Actinoplanes solisilvae TaxID=2486853 RepID=UPI00196BA0FD|nr:DUF2252 domain-containing protein [Actinoplanes solisilvae]